MKLIASITLVAALAIPEGLVLAADPPLASAASSAAKPSTAKPSTAKPSAESKANPAPVPVLALEADGVGFGMNAEGVAKLYDSWWEKQFVAKYRKANPGPKTRELDYQLAEKKRVLRRVSSFDGRSASFDKADFREEFAHGNGETMTSVKVVRRMGAEAGAKGVSYTRRFFFFENKLWKTYDEYKLDPQGPLGADLKEAAARVEASLGAGAKRTRGPDSQFESVAFETENSRVRVVKLPSNRVALVRSDNALARQVLDGRARLDAQASDATLDEDIQAVIR